MAERDEALERALKLTMPRQFEFWRKVQERLSARRLWILLGLGASLLYFVLAATHNTFLEQGQAHAEEVRELQAKTNPLSVVSQKPIDRPWTEPKTAYHLEIVIDTERRIESPFAVGILTSHGTERIVHMFNFERPQPGFQGNDYRAGRLLEVWVSGQDFTPGNPLVVQMGANRKIGVLYAFVLDQ